MPLTGERKREYQRAWIKQRREDWIKSQGSRCAECGSADGPFDIDHIDPTTKEIAIRELWSRTQKIRDAELAKCQLLCETCHQIKTNRENSTPLEHGNYSRGYVKGCKCEDCMEAMRIHWREYRASKKQGRKHNGMV